MEALTSPQMAVLLACLALAVAAAVFIFWIERDPSDSAPHRSRLDEMLDRREAIYENLRDLKFEFRAGKFSQGDFEEMQRALEWEAAVVMAEIEKITGLESPRTRRAAPDTDQPGRPA